MLEEGTQGQQQETGGDKANTGSPTAGRSRCSGDTSSIGLGVPVIRNVVVLVVLVEMVGQSQSTMDVVMATAGGRLIENGQGQEKSR